MTRRHQRYRMSAGSGLSVDAMFGGSGPAGAAAFKDMAAIDRGEGRTVFCSFRGLYGDYTRRFRGYLLDLTPGGPVLRPLVLASFLWRRIPVDDLLSAQVRPFESQKEAWNLASTGVRGPGGHFERAGKSIITCQTAQGICEFAVHRPDVPLFLHYVRLMHQRRQDTESAPPGRLTLQSNFHYGTGS